MAMAPLLFMAGMAFGYFVVLPGAVGFLQSFNASSFDALVQARTYYRFILVTLLATGLFFQIPVRSSGSPARESSVRVSCASTAATPSLPSSRWRCC